MSWGRVTVLLLLALSVGIGGTLVVEGNTVPVSLHLGSFPGHARAALWAIVGMAFLGGAIAASLVTGTLRVAGRPRRRPGRVAAITSLTRRR